MKLTAIIVTGFVLAQATTLLPPFLTAILSIAVFTGIISASVKALSYAKQTTESEPTDV
jgi:hypothetical protein